MEKRKAYKTIQERFKDFQGEYEPIEIDWGKPVGNENITELKRQQDVGKKPQDEPKRGD